MTRHLSPADPGAVEAEDIASELAAALPASRAPTITRHALHVVPFVLLAAASYVLWREFHEIRPGEIGAAIKAWGARSLASALAFSAASFLLMGATEWLGLRWAGVRIPVRTALGGSFMANSIAHSLGANLLVSGAIRARWYAPYGVSLKQVAATTLFSGLTFAVGLSTLAGAGLLLSPARELAALALPLGLARLAGVVLLGSALGYVILCAIRRRTINAFGHRFRLASPRMAVAQVCIGLTDNAIAAAIIWVLLPDEAAAYLSFVAAYALAVTAGLISHVPGGAGVFEGTLSALLPAADRAPLVAAFLGYRLTFFILPLMIGAAALAAGSLRRHVRR